MSCSRFFGIQTVESRTIQATCRCHDRMQSGQEESEASETIYGVGARFAENASQSFQSGHTRRCLRCGGRLALRHAEERRDRVAPSNWVFTDSEATHMMGERPWMRPQERKEPIIIAYWFSRPHLDEQRFADSARSKEWTWNSRKHRLEKPRYASVLVLV